MTTENVTEKKEPTLNDYIKRLNEQRASLVRSVISTVLKDSEKFKSLITAFNNVKRLVKTCETLLTDEGYSKQHERIQSKIDELVQELSLLKTKRNLAASSINSLKNTLEKHTTMQSSLAGKLTQSITAEMTTQEIQSLVEKELEGIDLTDLLNVVDPFETK